MQSLRIDIENVSTIASALYGAKAMEGFFRSDLINDGTSGESTVVCSSNTLDIEEYVETPDVREAGGSNGSIDK
jgi:hypothetical protein